MITESNLHEVLESMPKRKYDILAPLNEKQKIAAINYKGPSVIEAIPGSGKTKTLVLKTAYMIEDGVDPSSILLFSFTRKAANEIKERLVATIGPIAEQVTASTFHSFCARNLRAFSDLIGYDKTFSIYDDEEKHSALKDVLLSMQISQEDIDISNIAYNISRYKGQYKTPSQAREALPSNPTDYDLMITDVYEQYQRLLAANNAMDFDDLLFYMTWILEHNENARNIMHNRFKYICCDENQDSSYLDSKFIEFMVNEETNNICLLGDSDQAIYAFRGSSPDNLANLMRKFNAKLYHLDTNYRSTKTIVNAGKSLIDHNPILLDEKHPTTNNEVGDKIIHMTCHDNAQESLKISGLIEGMVRLSKDDEYPVKYEDIAILVRASYLTRSIEDAFLKYHIPYIMVNGVGFYDRMEIKDIVAYIKFIMNPHDMIALKRIANIPKKKLGEIAIKNITDYIMQESLKYGIISIKDIATILKEYANNDGSRYKSGINKLVNDIQDIGAYVEVNPSPINVIDKILTVTDYKKYLEVTDKKNHGDRWSNVQELLRIASAHSDLQEFIECMTLTRDVVSDDENDNKLNAVKIMTMHGSKGLEFKVVILPSCNDDIIPHFKTKTEKEIQEERRLMYVAITRAKKNLIISHTEQTFVFGKLKKNKPSRFISEIDNRYIKNITC